MKKIILLIFMFSLLAIISSAQKISNVEVRNSNNKIIVDYEISGARFFETFKVALYVSRDQGKTWEGPLKEVSGDVGVQDMPGSKRISWDVLNEMPILDEEFIFDVRAEVLKDGVKKQFFAQYVGSPNTPVGVRMGIIGQTGFYIEARSSLKQGISSGFSFTNNVLDNYNQSGYYHFSDNSTTQAFSVVLGTNYQISKYAFFYAGAGYGQQKKWVDFHTYEYLTGKETGSYPALSTNDDIAGLELSGGMIIKPGNFVLSAGVTALNFEAVSFCVGVGYAF